MINLRWLELPTSRTNSMVPKLFEPLRFDCNKRPHMRSFTRSMTLPYLFLRKTGSDISTTLIQGFNFTNSQFQLHEFTISTSRIHDFNFTNSSSRIQLHEFTNSTSRIHEFNFMNSRIQLHEFNFTNSTS